MEIVLVVLAVLAAGAAVAVVATTHRARRLRPQSGALGGDGPGRAVPSSPHSVALTGPSLGGGRLEEGSEPSAGPSTADLREQLDLELVQRRAEVGRIEERLLGKEQSIDVRIADLERRERAIADRQRNLEQSQEEIKCARRDQLLELERIAGLTAGQAKQIMLRELEDELEHDSARKIRQAEEEGRREADRRARSILATSMQRLAAGHAVETTVSVVQLRSDDLKGRIIGREGRNIRSLETLTGIDFIVDDTPSTVVLSGFDGVRREIARITLEKLLEDGRIHPARIEDAYDQAVAEMEGHIVEVGEQAVFDAEAGTLHGELTKLLGKLRYRTSYGQNVLAHSIECARLASLLADELGVSAKTAARAALLHDIGKAVSHEVEGPHALVGGELARRYKESEAVAHAMESHHNEVEPQTVEAVVVQIVDSLSGARPGARGASLEQYVTRLQDLEAVATRHEGVEKVYAIHAGREIRVIVEPGKVDDDDATRLSHQIARDVERELEYPGQIKITVIRESRSTDIAR